MKIANKKQRIKLTILLVLFKLVLDLSYVYALSPLYAYSGFTISGNTFALVESYFFVFIIGLVISTDISRPSHFFNWMFAVGVIIPTSSFYGLHLGNRVFMYSIIICYLLVTIICRMPTIKIFALKGDRGIGVTAMILLVCIVAISLFAKGGLKYLNFDLSKVYDFRREVSELINISFWGYLNTWVFKVINPALIGWCFWQKKNCVLVFLIALQVMFFGISSHKAVLFSPILIAVSYYFVKKKRALEYLTWSLISVVITSSVFSIIFNYHLLLSLFVRRTFFVPSLLNFAYYELFSEIGHVYLSNSKILLGLMDYPFNFPPQLLISKYLYGHYNCWANNGYLATAYMHFGFIGMFVFTIIVGLLLLLIDSLVHKSAPLWLGIGFLIIPINSLFISADLLTAAATHGIIIGMFILFLFRKKEVDKACLLKYRR